MDKQTQAAAMLARAQWHRAESENFLRHSVAAMHQHEREAEDLERRAAAMHDPHQAAEAAAFTLAHTKNQPRTTSAQTRLF